MKELIVKKGASERKIVNFWSNAQFHPTDAIEDHWGKEILDRISADNALDTVRVYAMLEDIVTRNKDGQLEYDFELNDYRLDYMVEKGFNLLICFNFMPAAIADNPEQKAEMPRYKNKRIIFSKPKDYKEWEEVCRVYTQHIVDRYGIDVVKNWKFHCWNEPDFKYWLKNTGASVFDEEKSTEYNKLYDFFAEGVRAVTDKIQIGGPSCAWNKDMTEAFIRHVATEKNFATGKKGSPVDFFSVHCYLSSVPSVETGGNPHLDWLLELLLWYRDTMRKYGVGEKEIFVDEWGETSAGFVGTKQSPLMEFRDTEYSSALFAKLIVLYTKEFYENDFNLTKMLFCLAGQHDLKEEFEGYRNFFSLNGFPKPIYNAYVLARKLGETLIESSYIDKHLGMMPTKDEEGNIKVLMYYMDEDFRKKLPNQKVKLKVEDVKGEYIVRHYRIDHNVSNSYTKWCECGRTQTTDQWQKEDIWYAGQLQTLYPEETVTLNGVYGEDIIMTQNSMSLVELIKVK